MQIIIVLFVCVFLIACGPNNKPNYKGVTLKDVGKNRCGVSDEITQRVLIKYIRGPVDGAFDENKDGQIDLNESFTNWDFNQTILVLMQGVDEKTISWTNLDTCYRFSITPHEFYENTRNKPIWQTCRSFTYSVKNNEGKIIGRDAGKACRNFVTFEWVIL